MALADPVVDSAPWGSGSPVGAPCLLCKRGVLRVENYQDEHILDGVRFAAPIAALRCGACQEWQIPLQSSHGVELAAAVALAEQGVCSPARFKLVRRLIGLRAVDLATLLDVTPETISHWETGRTSIPRAAWIVLGALAHEFADAGPSDDETGVAPGGTVRGLLEATKRSREAPLAGLAVPPAWLDPDLAGR